MHPSMAIMMRRRRPNERNVPKNDDEGQHHDAWTSESLNESSQDLLASPSLHSPVDRSHWRVNHTPKSSRSRGKKKSYIEKPRTSLKETEDRKLAVQEALDSAIQVTPASTSIRRRTFLQQQQKHLESIEGESLRDAVKWNALHDSEDRILVDLMKGSIAPSTPTTPNGRRDSTRTATTQASSQSTITSNGSKADPQSPYFRSWQPSKSSVQGSSPSSLKQPKQPRKSPTRSKSADSLSTMAATNVSSKSKPPIAKSMRNLMATTPPSSSSRQKSSSSSGNMKKSIDEGIATTSLILLEKTPSTPQTRQSKSILATSIDVSPWLKGSSQDGDGSSSKALTTPVRTPTTTHQEKIEPKSKDRIGQSLDETPSMDDSIQISYTPDSMNRTVEEQRALAKEMAEQLSRLPDVSATPEERKSTSWVAAERENANQHGPTTGDLRMERSTSFRTTNRPRWAARRIQSSRSLVHKREAHHLLSVSGHSRESTSRPKSSSPISTTSRHSQKKGHLTNLSGHSRESNSRSQPYSPNENTHRKAGKRPASFRRKKNTSGEENISRSKESQDVKHHNTLKSQKDVKQNHEMSIQVTEHYIDEKGRAVDIEVKGTLKERKKPQKELPALQRRRMERRRQIEEQQGERRETTSLREARTFSRPKKTSRHRSHSPTRNSQMVIHEERKTSPPVEDSNEEISPMQSTHSTTRNSVVVDRDGEHSVPPRMEEEPIGEESSPSKSNMNVIIENIPLPLPEKRHREVEEQEEILPEANPAKPNAPHHHLLIECSLNGSNRVINLNDWDSTSSHSMNSTNSMESKISPRRRTVPIDPEGDAVRASATPSIVAASPPSSQQDSANLSEDSCLGLGHVIHHMDILHDLERLAKTKMEELEKRNRERQIQAKDRLMQLIDGKVTAQDFGKRYHLALEDTQKLMRHVQLCLKTKEDIRWDLVFQILLPGQYSIGLSGPTIHTKR